MLRIHSGIYKGHALLAPPSGATTRPITGLARKSVFGMLANALPGAAVADLYCGTGTLGLEAISNGAASCCFAERDRRVIARLKRNIESLGCPAQCTVWPGDIIAGLRGRLASLEAALDVIFVDPPYADSRRWQWDVMARKLFAPLAETLSPGGVVIVRTPHRAAVPDTLAELTVQRRRNYGEMAVTVFAR